MSTEVAQVHEPMRLVGNVEPTDSLTVRDNRTGKEYSLPIRHNAVDASAFKAIRAPNTSAYLPDQTPNGLRLYDPGFQNTAVSESTITYVDGLEGTIQYRGTRIEDLIGKVAFEDTAHLLVWGRLPNAEERADFVRKLQSVPVVPQSVFDAIQSFPKSAPPITMLTAGLSAMQATQPNTLPAFAARNLYMGNLRAADEQIVKMFADYAVISAIVYCHMTGNTFREPRSDFSYIENLLYMMGHVDPDTGLPKPKHVSCMTRLWTLVADHEMTCSTAAFLHTASSLSDALSCQIAAITASSGVLHGGAIEVAYKNIREVGDVANVPRKIESVKSGKERLFGYGHRLYKTVDPRSVFIREILDELSEETARDPDLSIAMELDRVASSDEYFTSRKLKANADMFASFAYKAMGFPIEFILPLSILSRSQGLMAHWREAMTGKPNIWRPQQLYTGKVSNLGGRDYAGHE